MERPKCKLCFRIFANGRALGGHMKAHLANLKIHRPHVVESITSSPSSSSSGDGEQESSRGDQEIEEKSLIYGLRENPRRSFKCADPEFSFSGGSGFAIVQDRESETESRNPTQRRSKRARRKLGGCNDNAEDERQRKPMPKPSQPSSPAEPEPVSSVSDTSPEEDVAMCLMMLSRDKWGRKRQCHDDDDDDHEEVQEGRKGDLSGNEAERKHHQCEVCKKVFRSSQALGGHRVIHKKAVGSMGCEKKRQEDERERRDHSSKEMVMARKKERVYECPFCGRVFGNGQALGGHKRSHLMGLGGRSSVGGNGDGVQSSKSKLSANLIDLNLPAPVEEDDFSVVSDNGEFTQPIEN